MNNLPGIIGGFVIGMAGFLFAFKWLVLDVVPPSDEVPPGIVMLAAVFCGVACAFAGRWFQGQLRQRGSSTESEP